VVGLVGGTLALVTVGAWGVVTVLDGHDTPAPVVEECRATYEGTAWALTPARSAFAALIGVRALATGLPARAATIALATAYQESTILNLDHGDRDSLGLFQQRPSQGWGTKAQVRDPVHATTAFYAALVKVDGYREMSVTEAAQAVQRSGFPEAYADHEALGRAWASALHGYSTGDLTCTLAPVVLAADGTFDDGLVKADDGSPPAAPLVVLEHRLARDLPELELSTGRTASTASGDGAPDGSAAPDGGTSPSGAPTATLDATDAARAFDAGKDASTVDRVAWALGQWAVAVAAETGTVSVDVTTSEGAMRWSRSTSTWAPVTPAEAPGVTLTFPAPATG